MKIMILAGGLGSRLWPYSKKGLPKQFIDFGEKESLFKQTVKRFAARGFLEDIYILTNNEYLDLVKQQLSEEFPSILDRVFVEPCNKNTAPAISWGVRNLLLSNRAKQSDAVLVVPSDHFFSDEDAVVHAIQSAEKWAFLENIVAFGVKPERAETGYGYLKGTEEKETDLFKVDMFLEKPKEVLAQKFAQNEDWLWNTGMYLFTIKTFLEELKTYAPSINHIMNVEARHEDYVYETLTPESVDKAIMEKTQKLVVKKLREISWSDVGSFESLYKYLSKDENGNVKLGNIQEKNTTNCLILGGKKLISLDGAKNLIIVESEEAIFIGKRKEVFEAEKLMEELEQKTSLEVFVLEKEEAYRD